DVALSVERIVVGALVSIATGAGRRPAEAADAGYYRDHGNTAGRPAASSRDLKILQQRVAPLVERIVVGALVSIATGAARRPGGGCRRWLLPRSWQHRRESFGLQS
ncbi:hypothetical protein DU490_02000, partial [Halomonas sp. DQ26W]|uniref:hypothetical protein n=1 Tax=Halomonas sp. DQ26W TaxID=2282311 RepID=UPI000E1670CB